MVSVVATSLVRTPMAKKRTPASCSVSCMSSNHLNVNFPDPAPRSASTIGALSHKTFSTNSTNPEGVVMSTLSASLKKWEKDPCTLFSVSQSISVTGQFSAWKKSTKDVMRVLLPPPPFPRLCFMLWTQKTAVLFRIQPAKKADTRTNRIQQFIEMLEKNEKPHPLIGLNLFSKRARATDLGLPRV